jgi:BspA type Leucine rich repeat region (6 copies)
VSCSIITRGTLIQYPGGRHASSYTLPGTVTNIAARAFDGCAWPASITFGDSVLAIGDFTFQYSGLTNITFGGGLQSIGKYAFASCPGLNSVVLPASLTNLGACAFYESNLEGAYFKGNAPSEGVLSVCAPVYYLPGTTGWGAYFGNGPTAAWVPRMAGADPSFGTRTNQFGFNIIWAGGEQVVIQACTDLATAEWQPFTTNTLPSDISFFSDPDSTGHRSRFYRLRAP